MVNDLSSMDDLELMPLGGGYMVRRERLMNELIAKGRKAGIVVLYAPDGFGKTFLPIGSVPSAEQAKTLSNPKKKKQRPRKFLKSLMWTRNSLPWK